MKEHAQLDYPATPTVDAVARLGGAEFADPYQWLVADSDAVRDWQTRQSELASSSIRGWGHWPRVRALVEQYSRDGHYTDTVPSFAGGLWFREQAVDGSAYPLVLAADEPFGDGRILVDLSDYKLGENAPVLSWLSPSPDGRILAVGICTDGSEQNTITLIDVASGLQMSGAPTRLLLDCWGGGVTWLPDSSGFYFVGLSDSVHEFRQAVFLHRIGAPPAAEPETIPGLGDSRDYTLVQVSRSGRWAVAVHRWANPIPVAIRDLKDPLGQWLPFITDVDGTVAGHVVGDNYVAITDVGAPRGRLVSIPLDGSDPNDSRGWNELIPSSTTVLRRVIPVGELLYITEFDDAYSQVRIVDGEGTRVGSVPMPGKGALLGEEATPFEGLPLRGHPDEFVFGFSTLTSSWETYRHRPGAETIELLRPAEITVDAVTEDQVATSPDGTQVPYRIVRPASGQTSEGQPTLIYAYGGYNWPLSPRYHGAMMAFVAAGGTYVHVHLRGGGEYGRVWWEGGRMQQKENCYADLYAVAEDLIAGGVTKPEELAVVGSSNGGLMCGVALTQRPDLWGAVVPRFPLTDLIGCCQDPYNRLFLETEYADIEDPDEVQRLARFSPYHLIRDGDKYPATYIDAGVTDSRCPPWNARKLAARLQNAQAGNAPILLHIWENVGHGLATEQSIALDQDAQWLAFVLRELGWTP